MFNKYKTSVELSKTRMVLFAISFFLLSYVSGGESGVLPITYSIYDVFGYGLAANYIVSCGALWAAIGAVVSVYLMRVLTKKKVILVSAVIFAVASIFCVAVNDPIYISVMRSLMGLGEGIMGAVVMAYVAQMFTDEEGRTTFTGYYNGFMTLVGAGLSYGAGMLSMPEWTDAFRVFYPVIPIIILAIVFIPELGMEKAQETAEQEEVSKAASGPKEKIGSLYALFLVDYVIYIFAYGFLAYFVSVYVTETGIGDAAFAGLVLSISTLSGFVTSFAFGKIYAVLRKNTATVSIALGGIALILLYLFPSQPICVVACVLNGLSLGAYFSFSYAYLPEIVPMSRIDDVMGYTTAVYSVTLFAVPFVASLLMGVFTGGLTGPLFLIGFGMCVAAFVIEIATNGMFKKAAAQNQQQCESNDPSEDK